VRELGWAVLEICMMTGCMAFSLSFYTHNGSDKYKPEGMARIRINEVELDNIAFQVKTIEMIVEAFCITALCREWGLG